MSTASLQRAGNPGATSSPALSNDTILSTQAPDSAILLCNASLSQAMTSLGTTRLTHMRLCLAVAASLAIFASLSAQTPPPTQTNPAPSTLPPTPATTPTATPTAPSVPLRPSQVPPNRAQVTYSNGMISVSADNSSLNQILRLFAVDTGMKITGSVPDERVFGNYGPADPAQVLSDLLDGTGINMVLVQHDDASLAELILTPRSGGPTPPNPNAASYNNDRFNNNNFAAPHGAFDQSRPIPPDSPAPPQNNPAVPPVEPAATPTPAGNSTQPDSPNGVKTPQQIYEQLQRLRTQQQQQSQPQTQPQ